MEAVIDREQQYAEAREKIRAGQAVHLNGRSASTEAELDFIMQAEPVEERARFDPNAPGVTMIDHSTPERPLRRDNPVRASDFAAALEDLILARVSYSLAGLPPARKRFEEAFREMIRAEVAAALAEREAGE